MKKKALITGITGQDGSYLAEFLLKKGYIVHGLKRKSSTFNTSRIDHIYKDFHEASNFFLHYGDLTDSNSIVNVISKIKPNEIYNLGAQSHVGHSFEIPEYTSEVTGLGTLRVLEALRFLNLKRTKFYQASTSELYGNSDEKSQNENTRFKPSSPYAIAKLHAYWTTVNFRNSYNMFCCNGILFNHESPIRGIEFVTRKITDGVAQIFYGKKQSISLGNIESKRDWGFAGDYVEAMWLMMQNKKSDDYVIASNKQHSIKDFLKLSFAEVGILDWKKFVKINENFKRPVDVTSLLGNYEKAKNNLGWTPKTSFKKLVKMMVKEDLKRHKLPGTKIKIISSIKNKENLNISDAAKRVSA